MRSENEVYFSIDLSPDGGLQLSINGGRSGYRICGPKYNGQSRTIKRHKITGRDIEQIRSYLRYAKRTAV